MCFLSDSYCFLREVGGRKLTLETRLANELAEFHGDISQQGLQFWKVAFSAMTNAVSASTYGSRVSIFTKNQNPSSGSDQKVIMLPCKSAPSRERVQLWLQAKKQYECLLRDRKLVGDPKCVELKHSTCDRTSPQKKHLDLPDSKYSDKGPEKVSELQSDKRNGLSLRLNISPVKAASFNSTPKSAMHFLDTKAKDQEVDLKRGSQVISSCSPELPTWQESPAGLKEDEDKKDLCDRLPAPNMDESYIYSTSPENVQPRDLLSPSPFQIQDQVSDGKTLYLLHSTPVLRRRRSIDDDGSSCSPTRNDGIVLLHTAFL